MSSKRGGLHCRPARVMYCCGVVSCVAAILVDVSDGFILIILVIEALLSNETCSGLARWMLRALRFIIAPFAICS